MIEISAILVNQPIGQFYLCSIPYTTLERIAIPDALTLENSGEEVPGYYKLKGNQREEIKERRTAIGEYINSVEATFPNTIILAANLQENGEILDQDSPDRWLVTFNETCNTYTIRIPDNYPTAKIIDGQHRVRGFRYSDRPETFDLPCSIFMDISLPEQATIFATININQKKVDRSLAFNLFAYNLDDERSYAWAPDKLSVFFTRRLSVESKSPLKGHIKVIARQGRSVYKADDWHVSTSVFVDGISSLFSKNVARDRDALNAVELDKRRRDTVLSKFEDDSPFRKYYIENNDLLIYQTILNFFKAFEPLIENRELRGFLTKSIGMQALLEFLRDISYRAIEDKNISEEYFSKFTNPLIAVDFNSDRISANSQGKSRIKNFLLYANDLPLKRTIKSEDQEFFDFLLE